MTKPSCTIVVALAAIFTFLFTGSVCGEMAQQLNAKQIIARITNLPLDSVDGRIVLTSNVMKKAVCTETRVIFNKVMYQVTYRTHLPDGTPSMAVMIHTWALPKDDGVPVFLIVDDHVDGIYNTSSVTYYKDKWMNPTDDQTTEETKQWWQEKYYKILSELNDFLKSKAV